jgi:hypothetical protein
MWKVGPRPPFPRCLWLFRTDKFLYEPAGHPTLSYHFVALVTDGVHICPLPLLVADVWMVNHTTSRVGQQHVALFEFRLCIDRVPGPSRRERKPSGVLRTTAQKSSVACTLVATVAAQAARKSALKSIANLVPPGPLSGGRSLPQFAFL